MAGKFQLKILSFAFKEISLQSFNQLMHSYNVESAEFRQELETDLVYLTTIGLEDPLIHDVKKAVQLIRFGKVLEEDDEFDFDKDDVNVRMITGDHIETARAVAVESGIITESESNTHGVVMTGDQFLE